MTTKLKKNRMTYLLIALVVIVIWANTGEEKKEAKTFETCNQYNTFSFADLNIFQSGWAWEDGTRHPWSSTGDEANLCKLAGCIVAEPIVPGSVNPSACVPYALDGWIVDNIDDCKSGCIKKLDDGIACKVCDEGEKPSICNSNEKQIGDILKDILPSQGCKTRYYIIVFGGGLAVLMFILAAL